MIFGLLRNRNKSRQEVLPPLKSFGEVLALSDKETRKYLDTLSVDALNDLIPQCLRANNENPSVLERSIWLHTEVIQALQRKEKTN